RDIILGRKVGSANTVRARRGEKRMVEACERRILEFPLGMDAREVAKELKPQDNMLSSKSPQAPKARGLVCAVVLLLRVPDLRAGML
ncbi:MAG: hypothetical protein WCD63_21145, partial [Terrimicrobiaceae bacterium]